MFVCQVDGRPGSARGWYPDESLQGTRPSRSSSSASSDLGAARATASPDNVARMRKAAERMRGGAAVQRQERKPLLPAPFFGNPIMEAAGGVLDSVEISSFRSETTGSEVEEMEEQEARGQLDTEFVRLLSVSSRGNSFELADSDSNAGQDEDEDEEEELD